MVQMGEVLGSLDEQEQKQKQEQDKQAQIDAVSQGANKVSSAVDKTTRGLKDVKGEVKVTNPDLAKSSDVNSAVEAINKLNLTTFMQNEGLPQLADNLTKLSDNVQSLQDKYQNEGLDKLSSQLSLVVTQLKDVSKTLSSTKIQVDSGLQKTIDSLKKSIDSIDFKPSVNVSSPDTKVVTTPIDLSSVVDALAKVEKAVSSQEVPDNDVDLSPVISGLQSVQDAITSLRFPVSNYVLPFRNQDGKAVQVQLDASGNIPTSGGGGGGGSVTQGTTPWVTNDPGIPDTLGQKSSANSTSVVIASDQTVPVSTATVDLFPATQNITAQDIATSTVAGFNGQSYVIGNPTTNSAATFTLTGIQTAAIQITGIWTGTLRIEASVDGGTTYSSKFSRLPGTVYAGSSAPTSNCLLLAAVSNYNRLRIRSSTAWTGTAVVTVTESVNEHVVDILNPIRLLDSTTSTLMTIKPASTAPLATDTAMVVALSPNTNLASGQPVINGEQTDFTGTFTNATQTGTVVATNLDGYGNVMISINGTYSTATAVFEGSDDSGTTWYSVQASRDNTNVIETGYTSLTNTSQTWQINNPGFDSIRVRSTAVASGTVNVRMSASAAPGAAGANVAIGSALPTGTNSIGKVSDITTSVVPGIAATNLGKAEDAAHTTGDTGVFMLGVRNDTSTAFSGTDLDYTPIATDSAGTQYVVQKSSTATLSNVASSATSVTILAANTARKGAQIYNDSTQILYVKFGTTASTSSFTVPLAAATYYELPAGYTGRIDGIWASANGNARVTEET